MAAASGKTPLGRYTFDVGADVGDFGHVSHGANEGEENAVAPSVVSLHSAVSFSPSLLNAQNLESILSKRLREHEAMLDAYRTQLGESRQWLTKGMQPAPVAPSTPATKASMMAPPRRQQLPAGAPDVTPIPTASPAPTASPSTAGGGHTDTTSTSAAGGGGDGGGDRRGSAPQASVAPPAPWGAAAAVAAGFTGQQTAAAEAEFDQATRHLGLLHQKSASAAASIVARPAGGRPAPTLAAHPDDARKRRASATAPRPFAVAHAADGAERAAKAMVARAALEDLEMAEVTATPKISAESARLAERRKAKEGLAGAKVEDALLDRDARAKAEKWLRLQYQAAKETPGVPEVTPRARRLERAGEVGERLHADAMARQHAEHRSEASKEVELSRLVQDAVEAAACTHTPDITPRARNLRRATDVTENLYSSAVEQQQRRADAVRREEEGRRSRATPLLNPRSIALAESLQETAKERLCRARTPNATRSAHAGPPESPKYRPTLDLRSKSIAERRARSLTPNRSAVVSPARFPAGRGKAVVADGSEGDDFDLKAGDAPPESTALTVDAAAARHALWLEGLHKEHALRNERLTQLRQRRAEEEVAGLTFVPQISKGTAQYLGHGAPGLVERVNRWQQRREQRLQEQEVQEKRREIADCTFTPSTNSDAPAIHRMPIGAADLSGNNASAAADGTAAGNAGGSIYGGDGKAWGFDRFVDRQQAARRRKEDEEELRARVFASGTHWKPVTTVPVAPTLGRRPSDAEGAIGEGDTRRSSPRPAMPSIPSLLPPHIARDERERRHREFYTRQGEEFLASGGFHHQQGLPEVPRANAATADAHRQGRWQTVALPTGPQQPRGDMRRFERVPAAEGTSAAESRGDSGFVVPRPRETDAPFTSTARAAALSSAVFETPGKGDHPLTNMSGRFSTLDPVPAPLSVAGDGRAATSDGGDDVRRRAAAVLARAAAVSVHHRDMMQTVVSPSAVRGAA